MDIDALKKFKWEKYWSSSRSLLGCSYWGHYYLNKLAPQLGRGFTTALIISRNGHSTCYFDKEDRRNFGTHRIAQMKQNWPHNVYALVEQLKQKCDALTRLSVELSQKPVTAANWEFFIQNFFEYIGLHISPRNIIDYLEPSEIESVQSILTEARLYTEPVFEKTEDFLAATTAKIAKENGYETKQLLCCFKSEIEDYFKTGALPPRDILNERLNGTAFWWRPGGALEVVVGPEVATIESGIIVLDTSVHELKGTVAYPGVVRGRAKIVFKPELATDFLPGDILITTMTRPEYLFLMKKAAAIVTDVGGLLCHAAITAREYKTITVIGTEIATKVFKDGDLVEVDAERGIIKKIS